ncbi:MAG: TetR/AcrR family transcriptional regulator [Arachidicoccus sp.]|nr:TetR/AcrR family transcriptional regulator [Arachidicoccus sp.]
MDNNDNSIKNKILNASKEVFRRYGYAKVSMDDLSKAAGMARSSLYYYYKSKKSVFSEVVIEECADVMDIAVQKTSIKNSLEGNFINYNQAKIKQLNLKFKEYNHIIMDLRTDNESLYYFRNFMRVKEEYALSQLIQWAIKNKEISMINHGDMNAILSGIIDVFSIFDLELFLLGKVERFTPRLKNQVSMVCEWLHS